MNRKIFHSLIFGIVALCSIGTLSAETLTAICSEPRGPSLVKIEGKLNSTLDNRISGARPTYTWDLSSKLAKVILQDSAAVGGLPTTYTALPIKVSDRQLAFIVMLDRGIEVHSLFLDTGDLIFTQQKDMSKLSPGSISSSQLHSDCKISPK